MPVMAWADGSDLTALPPLGHLIPRYARLPPPLHGSLDATFTAWRTGGTGVWPLSMRGSRADGRRFFPTACLPPKTYSDVVLHCAGYITPFALLVVLLDLDSTNDSASAGLESTPIYTALRAHRRLSSSPLRALPFAFATHAGDIPIHRNNYRHCSSPSACLHAVLRTRFHL